MKMDHEAGIDLERVWEGRSPTVLRTGFLPLNKWVDPQ